MRRDRAYDARVLECVAPDAAMTSDVYFRTRRYERSSRARCRLMRCAAACAAVRAEQCYGRTPNIACA